MLAIGVVDVLDHYGALSAAQKLMTPLFKPLMDVPGLVGLALITDLQSTDAGAALTKELYDDGLIDKREQTIIAAWQYSGAGTISNYFAIAGALFGFILCPIIVPVIIIMVMKFVGAMICRFALDTVYKGDFKMTTETRPVQIKPNIFDIFIGGARKGWNLATQNLVPNILMAYVIAYILNILGVMDFLGYWLGPIMGIFGLPGQSFVILLTTWLSCSAGVGVAASLYASGIINGEHVTILMPALILMASQIQYMGRLLGLADVPKNIGPYLW